MGLMQSAASVLPGSIRPNMPTMQRGGTASDVVQVNMNQSIAVGGNVDPGMVRRKMQEVQPEIERLIKRTFADMQAQNRRAAYVQ